MTVADSEERSNLWPCTFSATQGSESWRELLEEGRPGEVRPRCLTCKFEYHPVGNRQLESNRSKMSLKTVGGKRETVPEAVCGSYSVL